MALLVYTKKVYRFMCELQSEDILDGDDSWKSCHGKEEFDSLNDGFTSGWTRTDYGDTYCPSCTNKEIWKIYRRNNGKV